MYPQVIIVACIYGCSHLICVCYAFITCHMSLLVLAFYCLSTKEEKYSRDFRLNFSLSFCFRGLRVFVSNKQQIFNLFIYFLFFDAESGWFKNCFCEAFSYFVSILMHQMRIYFLSENEVLRSIIFITHIVFSIFAFH